MLISTNFSASYIARGDNSFDHPVNHFIPFPGELTPETGRCLAVRAGACLTVDKSSDKALQSTSSNKSVTVPRSENTTSLNEESNVESMKRSDTSHSNNSHNSTYNEPSSNNNNDNNNNNNNNNNNKTATPFGFDVEPYPLYSKVLIHYQQHWLKSL